MKIVRIRIQNYGALFGQHVFELADRGLVLVLGENLDEPRMKSNGAAKSTIFDALDWALFGVVPRGDHVDSVVNEDAGGDVRVEVDLATEHGEKAQVRRWRKCKDHPLKPSGVYLSIGDRECTALDDAETQRRIEALLGLDREVFHALVLHAQTDQWNFAAATDGERIELLTTVLRLGAIDTWLEAAKVLHVEQAKACEVERVAVATLETSLREAESQNYDAQIEAWRIKNGDEIIAAAQLVSTAQQALAALPLEGDRGEALRRLSLLREYPPRRRETPAPPDRPVMPLAPSLFPMPERPAPPDIEEIREAVVRGVAGASQSSAAVTVQQTEVARLRQAIADLQQKTGGVCGVCGQKIDPGHVAVEVARLSALVSEAEAALRVAEGLHGQWTGYLAAYQVKYQEVEAQVAQQKQAYDAAVLERERAYQAQLAAHNAGVSGLMAQHSEAVAAHRQAVAQLEAQYAQEAQVYAVEVARAEYELAACDRIAAERARGQSAVAQAIAALEAKRVEVNPWLALVEQKSQRVADLQRRIVAVKAALERAEEELRYFDFWVDACGPRGLKSFILDARVQELTDAANHWMRLLFGGTSWIRFETQTQGRSTGKLANKINVRCFRYMPDGSTRERNFKSLSGGEKQRTSLAIDLGLSRIIASRAEKGYDLLILDEVFRHLDSAGREAVVDVLQSLRAEKSSIFCVDHSEDFQGCFERRVLVRKKNGKSTIQEEENTGVSGLPDSDGRSSVVPVGARPKSRKRAAVGSKTVKA